MFTAFCRIFLVVLITSMLAACGGDLPKSEIDGDAGGRMENARDQATNSPTADAGSTGDDAGTPPGSESDAGTPAVDTGSADDDAGTPPDDAGSFPFLPDFGSTETDAGGPAGDMNTAPTTLPVPSTGPFQMERDFGSQFDGTAELHLSGEGVLVIEIVDTGSVELDDPRLKTCDLATGDCHTSWFRDPDYDFQPLRVAIEIEGPSTYTIELTGYDSNVSGDVFDIELGVDLMTYELHQGVAANHLDAVPLSTPSAHRLDAGAAPPAWFSFQAPAPGALTFGTASNGDISVCDRELFGGVPERCDASAPLAADSVYVDQGINYIIVRPASDTTPEDLWVFFDVDPNGLVCAAGDHRAGDSTCVAEGQCAAGYHDGGWGMCVPDGTCSNYFQIRPDGRCEGWLGMGAVDHYSRWHAPALGWPSGHIMTGGYYNDGSPYDFAPSLYDPVTDSWNHVAHLSTTDLGLRFCPLSDGRVLTIEFGGFVHPSPVDSEAILDPADGSHRPALNTSGKKWARPSCLRLSNGKTLVYGGDATSLFDPNTETWSDYTTGLTTASDPEGAELNGVVYAASHNTTSSALKRLHKWPIGDASWSTTGDWHHSQELDNEEVDVWVADDRVILIHKDGDVTEYDPVSDSFIDRSPAPPTASGLQQSSSQTASNGDVVAAKLRDSIGLYDPDTDTWQKLPKVGGTPVFANGELHVVSHSPVRFHVAP